MIELTNLAKIKLDEEKLLALSRKVLLKEGAPKKDLSIVFVGPQRIRQLNKKYRQKDQSTDVLSFAEKDLPAGLKQIGFSSGLGELIICPIVVKKNSREAKIAFETELAHVLVHGILHLFGYDHEKSESGARKMRAREKTYLSGATGNVLK